MGFICCSTWRVSLRYDAVLYCIYYYCYGVLHFCTYKRLFVFSSLFKSPLRSFEDPIDLNKWFPQSRVSKKRKEIRELILNIQNKQQMAEIAKDG